MTAFPPKPPAPSVRQTIGSALERARGLSQRELELSREQLVEDIIARLDLPPALQAALRRRAAEDAPNK